MPVQGPPGRLISGQNLLEAGTGRSQQVKVAYNGALGGYKEGYVNAHKLTNAARAAVYGLSTRTGARRARIGRRLSVDDRRFDGASAYRYIPSHGQRRSKVPCQLIPWSAIAAVAMQ